ncbi:glycosyltransferase family 4 protein [Heyndrickxia sp. NPDC080065]|uniref:glycosyltransferase family 4 protein n=1 Tax=Heyndrickxia sp. NPDC080065 TaxID=3390568 RepID=UPI003D0665EF
MKVVLLAPTPPPVGGIAGWTLRMQKATLKNGWNVEVVDEKLLGNREVFGSNTKPNLLMEIKRCFRIWKDLYKALKDPEVKVVHSCIPASTTGMLREYICAMITKVRKRKFIIHYRCTLPNMVKSTAGLLMFQYLTKISDLVITLNSTSVDYVKKYSNTNVKLIPNFIEKDSVLDNEKRIISNKIKRVLYVGGVIESKGCCEIINVANSFPDIQFRLVGNPDKKVLEIDKPANVILCGEKNREEVQQELVKADLFMFVSYFPGEGFSNALAEAMSYGLPCIVSDWAANHDMIEEYGGIVVSVKDVGAMIKAIEELANDRNRRQRQSEWNIKKVKENYVDNIVTDQYVDAYESILEN